MARSRRQVTLESLRKRMRAIGNVDISVLAQFIQPQAVPAEPRFPERTGPNLRRILILTADTGFGHRSAALALKAALEDGGTPCEVFIENPEDDPRAPAILRDSQADYDYFVRHLPEIYRIQYKITFSSASIAVLEQALTVMLFGILQDLVQACNPDVIVTTHPHYVAPLSALNALGRYTNPFTTVVTDITGVHKMWFNEAAEMTFLPTDLTRDEALEFGMPGDKLKVTGIPVNPILEAEKRSKAEIRAHYGWDTKKTLILAVGSKRVKGMEAALQVLNHSGFPIQLVAVAGGDDDLFQALSAETWHVPAFVYNFVQELPAYLKAADLILTKAGGLIVSEALAAGLPLLLADVTPGQEEGNASFVVSHGAGLLAVAPLEVLESAAHLLENDGTLLKEMSERACWAGRPCAASDIAAAILGIAERGPVTVPPSIFSGVPSLKSWLGQVGISLDFLDRSG